MCPQSAAESRRFWASPMGLRVRLCHSNAMPHVNAHDTPNVSAILIIFLGRLRWWDVRLAPDTPGPLLLACSMGCRSDDAGCSRTAIQDLVRVWRAVEDGKVTMKGMSLSYATRHWPQACSQKEQEIGLRASRFGEDWLPQPPPPRTRGAMRTGGVSMACSMDAT